MTPAATPRKRAIVADDDHAFRVLIEQVLIDAGLDVECVGDGDEAYRRASLRPPDLLLLDNVMPGRSGNEVCKILQDELGENCPPIVMITGCDGDEDIRQAFDAGAIDYLVKPVNWELLKFRIPKWLGKRPNESQSGPKHRGQSIEMMVTGSGDVVDVVSFGHLDPNNSIELIDDFLDRVVAARVRILLRRVLRVRESRQETFETEIRGRSGSWQIQLAARGREKVSIEIYENSNDDDNRLHLFRLAYIDPATGFPNQHLFVQTLKDRLDRAQFQQRGLAVVCVAVGGDTQQNSGTSRDVERLASVGRAVDSDWATEEQFVKFALPDSGNARLASIDSKLLFAIVDGVPESSWMTEILERATSTARPEMAVHIGVARYPQDGETVELLMDSAAAAAQSTDEMRNAAIATSMQHDSDLEAELLQALRDEQLQLYYQPRVCIETGKVIAAEALLRWAHPIFGEIGGAQLLARLTSKSAIRELTDWSTRTACRQALAWQKDGLEIQVTVNIADEQLLEESFAGGLQTFVNDLGLSPATIELEVFEASCDRSQQSLDQLLELRAERFGLVIDDFGSEKFNLDTLSRLAPNGFKIKKLSSTERAQGPGIVTIAKAIANSCSAALIAKHVESADELGQRQVEGFDQAQGFHICQPLAAGDFYDYIATLELSQTSSLEVAALT